VVGGVNRIPTTDEQIRLTGFEPVTYGLGNDWFVKTPPQENRVFPEEFTKSAVGTNLPIIPS
jgi:hypothetical protein